MSNQRQVIMVPAAQKSKLIHAQFLLNLVRGNIGIITFVPFQNSWCSNLKIFMQQLADGHHSSIVIAKTRRILQKKNNFNYKQPYI